MTQKTTWEKILEIPDDEFFANPLVKDILNDFPTREDIRENARYIIQSNTESPNDETSSEGKIWVAHENLWHLIGSKEQRIKRKALRDDNILHYKKLKKYICSIGNEYPTEIKTNPSTNVEKYKNIIQNTNIVALKSKNIDLGDDILHKPSLRFSTHNETHLDEKDITKIRSSRLYDN